MKVVGKGSVIRFVGERECFEVLHASENYNAIILSNLCDGKKSYLHHINKSMLQMCKIAILDGERLRYEVPIISVSGIRSYYSERIEFFDTFDDFIEYAKTSLNEMWKIDKKQLREDTVYHLKEARIKEKEAHEKAEKERKHKLVNGSMQSLVNVMQAVQQDDEIHTRFISEVFKLLAKESRKSNRVGGEAQ